MADRDTPVQVLFVCLGNHCRSPAAHAVANQMLAGRTFASFDSAGLTRAHVGDLPHGMSSAEAHRKYTRSANRIPFMCSSISPLAS